MYVCMWQDDWISEAALWTSNWVHLGKTEAATECKLVAISSMPFKDDGLSVLKGHTKCYHKAHFKG